MSKKQFLVVGVAALIAFSAAGPAFASPLLFDSLCRIDYTGKAGGQHFYTLNLWAEDQPYLDLKIALDPELVTPDGIGMAGVGDDALIQSAELLSHPDVPLFISAQGRAVSNVDNSRFLDDNLLDGFSLDDLNPLPDGTQAFSMRLGMSRELTNVEMYQVGFWAGDLRGLRDTSLPFTESDGMTVPEPGTLFLLGAGVAGAAAARRRRRS